MHSHERLLVALVVFCLYVCYSVCVCVLFCQNRGSVVRALSRAPMLWSSANHAGFTTAGSPWLPVHPSYHTNNVEVMHFGFILCGYQMAVNAAVYRDM